MNGFVTRASELGNLSPFQLSRSAFGPAENSDSLFLALIRVLTRLAQGFQLCRRWIELGPESLWRPLFSNGFDLHGSCQLSAVEKVSTVYASADQSATQVTFSIPRTLNGARPRLVLVSALIVSLVEARCL
jgi:hypothetical protein